jgi:hypothetical protein
MAIHLKWLILRPGITVVGEGSFVKSVSVPGKMILNVWENNKEIKFKRLPL